MAESESENRNTKPLPNQTPTFPRNLLQGLVTRTNFPEKMEGKGQETEEIELTLGLSMGGRFGVDPVANEKLRRSSSISNSSTMSLEPNPLLRTCSLPTEDSRKRKEFESMRPVMAKRNKTEKMSFGVENGVEEKNSVYVNGFESKECNKVLGGNLVVAGGHCGGGGVVLQSSPGSIGSQGSGSSGVSDLESQPVQGANTTTKEQSPSSVLSNRKPFHPPPPTAPEKPTKVARNVMEEMPCVSTRGDGPNGRKIEGFLYRYRKGEEVRIVCVCHGRFLSPAEFVKHGGGGDVTHPLRHIVVNATTLL